MQAKRLMTNLIKLSFKLPLWKTLEGRVVKFRWHYSNKNSECFRTDGCSKCRNGFMIEKFVVLAEYFEQQTDCWRYRRNISQ